MPRNVRNFWVEVEIDGQVTRLAGGPKAADGGFVLTVKQRDHGRVTTALTVDGLAVGSDIELTVFDHESKIVLEHNTVR